MEERLLVRRAAVLGAGVMGAQIAAHFANAGIEVVLFDMPSPTGDRSGLAAKGIAALLKLDPAPFAVPDYVTAIRPANYEDDLALLGGCDLVIEAIAERMDIKQGLFAKLLPHLAPHAILGTNTSGLSIERLAETLPADLQRRFCGIHFFNPPRYMALVELIPAGKTDSVKLDALEEFLVSRLGKSVVRGKDTPNFVANRVGVFSFLSTMHHAERLAIPFEVVDALTGPQIGRARSATFRTLDVVGLDVMGHVVKTMYEGLPDDPWRPYYQLPKWFEALVAKGALGKKVGAGVYRKVGGDILVFDSQTADYRKQSAKLSTEMESILKMTKPAERFGALLRSSDAQARFLVSLFRDLFHYCAVHAESIAQAVADIDNAMRWGFGWEQGPFEIWDAGGFKMMLAWLQSEIAAGRSLTTAPLPAWLASVETLYSGDKSFSPSLGRHVAGSSLGFYSRHVPSGALARLPLGGTTLFENEGVRLWKQEGDVAILSFRTKMHTFDEAVLTGIARALDIAESSCRGMVVWHEPPFSAGANLQFVLSMARAGDSEGIRAAVRLFQKTNMRVKYAQIPVVAAVQGLALGGGCELMLHCAKVVAALETYAGLVEFGVGLIPAGAGTKELAVRSAQLSKESNPFNMVRYAFEAIAMAKVSKSGEDARAIGLLRSKDTVVFHPGELLSAAKAEALALAAGGYRPPLPAREVRVCGRMGLGNFKASILNMQAGKFITPYDAVIAEELATVICGGEVEAGSVVSEEWLLHLEEEAFVRLCARKETQDRMEHMLKTGKPLRN
jgi:3-hydroxyacyl-CoA dehydrogenase